jgi:hypothetical protein
MRTPNREQRRNWIAALAAAGSVVGLAAWWGSRVESPKAEAPPPDPVAEVRKPDLVMGNHFGRVAECRPHFFCLREQPAVGVVLRFEDGRTVAFACHPSQFGSIADVVGTDCRVQVGERDGCRDWLLFVGP